MIDQRIKKQRVIIIVLVSLLVLIALLSLGIGYSSVSFDRIIPTIFGEGTFKEEFVLFSVRLPRIFITILAGMALALSGAILQSITRNDLADPGIIGINAGAGVGVAVFFLYFPIEAGNFVYILPIVAFMSALFIAALIYIFSYTKGSGIQPIKLILVGVGFSLACSGAMVVMISSAADQKVDFIAKWLAGSIWGTDWPFILALVPWLVLLVPFIFYKASKLDLLAFSEPVAVGVGVKVEKERLLLLIAAVALAAAAVSVTGGISFIGLMAPHIAKSLIGPRNHLFIPIAMLMGGLLLLVADTIGRNAVEPEGIAAGIVTALIGAPYFIVLLLRKK
ncbi:FecCD family ABC transporter permease [Gracilibacillus kekensis]|uniref:Iron complex transport system permease protein n=1 Tax=Gracilibacillus kekensis TaxID=1027249 RepID=A0A1M7K4M9_9BACI|nr:iron ABC transporter permease [Gracilibacillus kekensis]SHM60262.1 iron complex transport system permease protein [Gracilibacillus kekensis]